MKMVMGLCQRIVVANQGRILAEGTPEVDPEPIRR